MIEIVDLSKEYVVPPSLRQLLRGQLQSHVVCALTGLNLTLERGQHLAVMGPNGAGKSTLLRILAGLTTPTSGSVRVAGCDSARGGARLRRRVGLVLADERSFSLRLSARENLAFFAALHGLPRSAALMKVDRLLERVGLGAHARRPFHQLSTGMRQRVALARGLLGEPEVLLLDEPTRGIDLAAAAELRALLHEAIAQRTVLLVTHDVTEAAALAQQVALLRGGRIDALVPPSEVAAQLAAAGVAVA